ncbi:hypothetical protein TPHA_0C01680 [Tetrapisispora phaffii CBS 4417]|uniref:Elongation factor 1-gamma 1 n=1 Tax=Tetrapisispora phaffii (strain ATCC 24235 / CBS 4417 / NBRC 1672 / NRRL Y-8282 / UCD 70-5) TaxID=1071381 RepID=G8BRE8_TETPH|nr:elongation factor 1 gamma domain-containing protein TPHA_0C01680 [Tetrapisispora phaffii CBS 4417]CCE62324.1 hypothetical protein TPHA_0C01680 [Tetrapisispora phaffii CBS 4417]
MSLGTLFSDAKIRGLVPRALVKFLKLDIKIVDPATVSAQFAQQFPLKKLPAFVDNTGVRLSEQLAVDFYLINLADNQEIKTQLLGNPDDFRTQSQILRWASLGNSDLLSIMLSAFGPLRGDVPYNKKAVDEALVKVEVVISIFEERLKTHTYLANEDITLADLICCASFVRGFNYLFGKEWRAAHPSIVRWFNTVRNSPIIKSEFTEFKFIDKQIDPPKKEKKEKKKNLDCCCCCQKDAEPAENAEPAPEKKAKHPLEALGKATFVLDEWKRKYSNEDTRLVALPWFWEHYNPEEYSLWKVEYKYNDELTQTFMSNNLVGGFFNRLSGSIKYMFGSLVVYGVTNDNGIVGAVLVRGQEFAPAFEVAPDWESYSYVKLDASKEEDKAFVNNMWAWDEPVIVNGVAREIADGKVLK